MKLNKLSDHDKWIVEEARRQWNNQCSNFLRGIPFRDKTMKECLARVRKAYENK